MANPLWDALFASLENRDTPLMTLGDGTELSGRAFHAMIARQVDVLAGCGLKPGDRIAVQVAKSPEALAIYGAAVALGAVYLPLNPAYTAAEVAYFLRDATPSVFVCYPARLAELEPVAAACGTRILTLDSGGRGSLTDSGEAGPIMATPRAPDDLAAILYTSGTTGRSKGAMLTQRNLLSNAQTLVDLWQFTDRDVLLHVLPIFHTHGLFVATNVVLASGGRMIFLPGFSADQVITLLPQATALMGVPTFYTRLLDHEGLTHSLVSGMRLFISGSAPLLAETHLAFERRTGKRILERYGMTETGMNTSNPCDGERRAGTVGFPLPDVELRIRQDGAEVPTGGVGILEVRGPNVFRGYWNLPEKTRDELREDGWFITGDLGRIDGDGYVHIVGRSKDLIISGGFNVYPKEVEEALNAVPGVLESVVIGVPHSDFGEAVFAVVVRQAAGLQEHELRDAVETRLARFKQPKAYAIVDDLPRNAMGKVQKNVLRETYCASFGDS